MTRHGGGSFGGVGGHGRSGGGSFGPPPPGHHPPPPGYHPPPPSFHPPPPHRHRPPPPMFPVTYYAPPPVFYSSIDRGRDANYRMPPPEAIPRPDRKKELLARSKAIYTFTLLALIIGTVWLYFGPYGSTVVELGVHDSRLITATPFLVDSIMVKNRYETDGPVFYIFDRKPPLNQESRWQDWQNATVQYGHSRDFFYWMNKGSTVTVYYTVEVHRKKEPVYLAMVRDNPEDLQDYYEKPNAVAKPLQGHGVLKYDVKADADYAFSVVSYNPDNVTVYLDLHFQTREYSTVGASQRSNLKTSGKLSLPIFFSRYGLLTGPGSDQMGVDVWEIQLSYGIRWTALVLIYGLVTLVYSVVKSRIKASINDEMDPEYAPLVPPQETQSTVFAPAPAPAAAVAPPSAPILPASILEEDSTALNDDYTENDIPEDKLCVICLERRKDSFFIPCGHNATCYPCGLKISQEDHAKCPICRQPIGDFKKLYDS